MLTFNTVGVLAAEHPLLVTVTVYDPVAPTVILLVVAPVLHRYELPELANNAVVCPVHRLIVPLGVIVTVGNGVTVTVVVVLVAVHVPLLTITL